jgi:hypothetical protein
MNQPPEHPSPALRAPSPLFGRGERDGVRGELWAGSRAEIAAVGGPLVLSMNRRFWSADAHVRSPLIRTWASGLLALGGSWFQCAAFGPWELPMNLVGRSLCKASFIQME